MTAADLVLREATLDDARFAADLLTELAPDDPQDPVLMRHWWATVDPSATVERYVALEDGRPVGMASMSHAAWEKMPERFARVSGDVLPALRTADRVGGLLTFAEDRARRDGALRVVTWAWEWDRALLEVLASRDFREERRGRFWELDLVANRPKIEEMTSASRVRMQEQGIRVLTVAEDDDPEKHQRLWRMSEEASKDTPRTVPWTETPFEVFMHWFRDPGIREESMWIARRGDEVVGISVLGYPPVRGVVSTDWTATARSVRGLGVARALKCETLMQAITLGVDRVRTDNDSQNAPILHINADMGYRARPEGIQLIKELGQT